jgi:hypothetical protein
MTGGEWMTLHESDSLQRVAVQNGGEAPLPQRWYHVAER